MFTQQDFVHLISLTLGRRNLISSSKESKRGRPLQTPFLAAAATPVAPLQAASSPSPPQHQHLLCEVGPPALESMV